MQCSSDSASPRPPHSAGPIEPQASLLPGQLLASPSPPTHDNPVQGLTVRSPSRRPRRRPSQRPPRAALELLIPSPSPRPVSSLPRPASQPPFAPDPNHLDQTDSPSPISTSASQWSTQVGLPGSQRTPSPTSPSQFPGSSQREYIYVSSDPDEDIPDCQQAHSHPQRTYIYVSSDSEGEPSPEVPRTQS
ncbi:hypothetical protein RSAG8_11749, partial [Rhizoctonia solani AG-8 WAC10335]